jgi:hypothetical protein
MAMVLSEFMQNTIALPRQARDKQNRRKCCSKTEIRFRTEQLTDSDRFVQPADLRKTHLRFEYFPYVCPEPVFVK